MVLRAASGSGCAGGEGGPVWKVAASSLYSLVRKTRIHPDCAAACRPLAGAKFDCVVEDAGSGDPYPLLGSLLGLAELRSGKVHVITVRLKRSRRLVAMFTLGERDEVATSAEFMV
jgi:hypothetical protein